MKQLERRLHHLSASSICIMSYEHSNNKQYIHPVRFQVPNEIETNQWTPVIERTISLPVFGSETDTPLQMNACTRTVLARFIILYW
jgi:hypothetical protein